MEQSDTNMHVSGTLDAITEYILDQYNLDERTTAWKVAILLALEQENVLIDELCQYEKEELDPVLFGQEEPSPPAQGMLLQTRYFLDLDDIKVKALSFVPLELVKFLIDISKGETRKGIISMLFRVACRLYKEITCVPKGLLCVCLRAWQNVGMKTNVEFSVEEASPPTEAWGVHEKRSTCDMTQDDDVQAIGHEKFCCFFHAKDNYCNLTSEKVLQSLMALERIGIVREQKQVEGRHYFVFL